jgi:hypothetical protein
VLEQQSFKSPSGGRVSRCQPVSVGINVCLKMYDELTSGPKNCDYHPEGRTLPLPPFLLPVFYNKPEPGEALWIILLLTTLLTFLKAQTFFPYPSITTVINTECAAPVQ